MSRHRRRLRRRYGRMYYDHDSKGRLYGARQYQELLEEEGAPTQRVPHLLMNEQVEYDRRERERRAHA